VAFLDEGYFTMLTSPQKPPKWYSITYVGGTVMNSRWRTTKGQLYLFIPLVGVLILMMSLGGIRPALAQNNLPLLNLVGNAVRLEDRLRLTADQEGQTGAAWLPAKQSVQGGFEATFQWQISRNGQEGGADGFAFVIQNASGLALGDGRSGIGYNGIPNSLAVEFDTLQNPPEEFGGQLGDPNGNHISVQTRGALPNSADPTFSLGSTTQGPPAIPLLADGNVHNAKVVYVPGTLTIFLDNLTSPVLSVPVDLGTTLSLDNGQAWVGFTAATGGRSQAHDILSFSFVGTEVAPLGVDIDIIPGSDPNSWPCRNTEEDLPAAILTTDTFDATTIDAGSVRFGKTGTEASEVHRDAEGKAERHVTDVNGDGRDDLVFHFRFGDTGFSCDDIPQGQESVGLRARLTGEAEGEPLAGEDTLQLVKQPDSYLALGDSVAAGQGASGPDRLGYAGLFRRFFRADHQGKEGFANLAVPGESSATFLGNQMARALETISDPDTNIQVVTLTLGANDFLPPIITEPCASDPGDAACQLAVATALTTFAGSYLAILAQLDIALVQDPGEGRILVTTYYNPFDGTGDPREGPVEAVLLGSDGAVDCAANLGDPIKVGLNDIITCVGGLMGAEIVDIYPLFNDAAPALTHIAEGDIHPNNGGHQAIADAVIAAYKGD
jgi:lysophospholipase L1-like esterase